MQKELEVERTATAGAKANDATALFQAMDRMLLHSANAEWVDTVGRYDKRNPNSTTKNWEKFKHCTSDFITRAVFKPDAYDRRKSHLQEHVKPFDLSVKEWSLRLETISRLMPWLIRSVIKLQKETVPTANWKDWWIMGSLTEADIRRILFSQMPPLWNRTIQMMDASRELQDRADVSTVASHLATLESIEKADRLRSTRVTGRSSRPRRISASTRPPSRPQNYRRCPPRQLYGGQPYKTNTCWRLFHDRSVQHWTSPKC